MELEQKITDKTARIAVIGLGHIGLPVASFFAAAGYSVTGIDLNEKLVQLISEKTCPLDEPGFEEIFTKALDNFTATTDPSTIAGSDIFIVCVQTPVTKGKPNTSYIESAFENIQKHLEKNQLVIIESTVPPGTSQKLWKTYGNSDCYLAHCPERVIPGNLCKEFVSEDRIVGGFESTSTALATALYSQVITGSIEQTDLTTAELVKVVENTYRNTNIALANEIAQICDTLGVNAFEVIKLANHHPRVHVHQPGCGVGGDCIPVAPILLTHENGTEPSVIQAGMKINEEMPEYLVNKTLKTLKQNGVDPKDAHIIVLGYTYKADTPETKNTPVKAIVEKLQNQVKQIQIYDPILPDVELKTETEFLENCKDAHTLILATNHEQFKQHR